MTVIETTIASCVYNTVDVNFVLYQVNKCCWIWFSWLVSYEFKICNISFVQSKVVILSVTSISAKMFRFDVIYTICSCNTCDVCCCLCTSYWQHYSHSCQNQFFVHIIFSFLGINFFPMSLLTILNKNFWYIFSKLLQFLTIYSNNLKSLIVIL